MTHHNPKALIFVIDDEPAILQAIQDALTDENFRVRTTTEGKQALAMIGELIPDLVLLDIFMPHCNGLDLLKKIKEQYPKQQVIIMSGFGTIPMAVDALNFGAQDFIEKPLSLDVLLEKVNAVEQLNNEEKKTSLTQKEHNYEARGIVGKSDMFHELMRQVDLVAPLAYNVLIYGAQGSGKSTIARYIHEISPRASLPFLTIDEFSTKELTLIDKAQEGTVYLKNIHLFSSSLQRETLAAIKAHSQLVRFIASASPNLFHFVQKKDFDTSLFYALNIIPLETVSLAKRRHDIPLLVSHFLAYENKAQAKNVLLSPQAMRCLRNYPWHGNIKELKITLKRLVSLSSNNQIISKKFLADCMQEQVSLFCEEQLFGEFASLDSAFKAFEYQFLIHLYKKNGYQLDKLSEQLKIDQAVLKEKIGD